MVLLGYTPSYTSAHQSKKVFLEVFFSTFLETSMLSNDADLTRSLLDFVSKLFSPSITKDCIRSSAQHGRLPKTILLCMVKSCLWSIRVTPWSVLRSPCIPRRGLDTIHVLSPTAILTPRESADYATPRRRHHSDSSPRPVPKVKAPDKNN